MPENIPSTHAIFVLDASGSMASIREAAITGFNEELERLRNVPGKVQVTLITFGEIDNPLPRVKYTRKDPTLIEKLNVDSYRPYGNTPMLDAVGAAILAGDIANDQRNLIIIVSDGAENASRLETWKTIQEKVVDRQNRGNWTFVYIGANQDLSEISHRMSIPINNTMAFDATDEGMRMTYGARGQSLMAYAASSAGGTSNYFGERVDTGVPAA